MNDLCQAYGPAAIVTGASDGIGRVFAERLAAAGFDLILVARREAELQRLAASLRRSHGRRIDVLAADLGQPNAIERVLAAAQAHDVGMLVAAAGFGSSGMFVERSVGDELNMIDVNCRAVVELCHEFARRFTARGRGGIVLFGSLVGWQGVPAAATYAATKAFVQSFAEAIGDELAPSGIDVLACAPGPVGTGFAARAHMTMGASDTPDQVASAALLALGHRRTVVAGRVGKLLTWSLLPLPRRLRVAIMGRIMRGMAASRGDKTEGPHGQPA